MERDMSRRRAGAVRVLAGAAVAALLIAPVAWWLWDRLPAAAALSVVAAAILGGLVAPWIPDSPSADSRTPARPAGPPERDWLGAAIYLGVLAIIAVTILVVALGNA